jgi:hypothetical protein
MTAAAAVARPPARLRRRVRSSPARTARRSRRESSAMVARGAREKSYSWHAAGTCRGPGSSAVEIAASRAGPPGPWFPPSRPTGARSTAASEPVAPVSRNTGVTPCRAQLLHASGLGEPAAASGAEGSSSSVPLAHCFRHSHRRDSFGHKPVAPPADAPTHEVHGTVLLLDEVSIFWGGPLDGISLPGRRPSPVAQRSAGPADRSGRDGFRSPRSAPTRAPSSGAVVRGVGG